MSSALRRRATRREAAERVLCRLSCVLPLAASLSAAGAQAPSDAPVRERRLAGHVERAVPGGLRPVSGAMVTLHRVGSDRAAPLDSMRTRGDGAFAFRFRPGGAGDAVYFASVTWAGITYFSTPATAEALPATDADITVFDTAGAGVPIHVAGRHVVIGAAADGRRPVQEIFELSNDSSVTLVSRNDSSPVWVTSAPARARDVRPAPTPDIAPAAITVRGQRVELFAPLSPGIRQFAFTYALPDDAFPLALSIDRPTSVLEVLVEEGGIRVSGPLLKEEEAVTTQGRSFRRFLALSVPAGTVMRVEAPPRDAAAESTALVWLVAALGAVMLAALLWALRSRQARQPEVVSSRELLHELAMLDDHFAAIVSPSARERERYEARRTDLRARVARVLAAERQPR